MEREQTFTTLVSAAAAVGVSPTWLRREADANRVPVLRVGRSLKFNIDTLREALLKRMERQRPECANA